MNLSRLKEKLSKRKRQRDRQLKKYQETKKRGHLRAFKKHRKAVRYLKHLIKNFRPESGTGPLAGTRSIINNEVIPVAKKYNAPITSRKRPADHPLSISNPGSDHNEANTTADAIDFGTYDGAEMAFEIAEALGINGYTVGNYNSYNIVRAGKTFRAQILWAVSGHYDHVHVGIKLV